jgi:hypothetical protein
MDRRTACFALPLVRAELLEPIPAAFEALD